MENLLVHPLFMLLGKEKISVEVIAVFISVISFFVTYMVIPPIINLVKKKNLIDEPNNRSSHKESTPTLGGIAFYLSIVISLFFVSFFYDYSQLSLSIVVGVTILFAIGVKDDLAAINPRTKIIAQLLSSFILLSNVDFCISSFSGFLGINIIPIWFSVLMGSFIILSTVNSYNLIDGINGSASMVGITIFVAFFYVFFLVNLVYYALISLVGIAFLFAFLRYNLSKNQRIFMGDTGSLIVGFLIGLLILCFLSLDNEVLELVGILPENKFVVVLSIAFIPFFDTLRVFTIRILKNGKPFLADRNHVHHIMIDYMHLSHTKASVFLGIVNISVFILIFFISTKLSAMLVIFIFILIIFAFTGILFYFNKSLATRKKKYKIRKILQNRNLFF